MRAKLTSGRRAAAAAVFVILGLILQFVTRTAVVEDLGLAAVACGLAALAFIVPALMAGSNATERSHTTEPPPASPH